MEFTLAALVILVVILVIVSIRHHLTIREMEANYDWAINNLSVTMTDTNERVDTLLDWAAGQVQMPKDT